MKFVKVLKKDAEKVKVKLYTNDPKVKSNLNNVEVFNTNYNARFVNVDNDEIFFVMAGKDPEYDSGVWIKSPYFVSALDSLFEKGNR